MVKGRPAIGAIWKNIAEQVSIRKSQSTLSRLRGARDWNISRKTKAAMPHPVLRDDARFGVPVIKHEEVKVPEGPFLVISILVADAGEINEINLAAAELPAGRRSCPRRGVETTVLAVRLTSA